jgi:hypothetical protein
MHVPVLPYHRRIITGENPAPNLHNLFLDSSLPHKKTTQSAEPHSCDPIDLRGQSMAHGARAPLKKVKKANRVSETVKTASRRPARRFFMKPRAFVRKTAIGSGKAPRPASS